jgi:hypothetical protein
LKRLFADFEAIFEESINLGKFKIQELKNFAKTADAEW